MRQLIALGLGLALLAGCASDDPEPAVVDTTDQAEQQPQTEQPPPEEDDADGDGDAAPDTDDAQPDAPDDVAPDDDGGAADPIDVEIGDFFFDDDQQTITLGDTVTWTHQGEITHNVTAQDDTFASDNLNPGDTFNHTFDTAGTFDYRCTLHSQMVATIDVS